MPLRRLLATCLLLLLAAPAADAGWWDDLDRGEAVSLSDLIAQHSRYRDRVVSFFCVYHDRSDVFAPLASPFSPQKHVNFSVWRDGEPVWEQEGFKRDYPFLYIGRTHPQVPELLSLEPFTRIEVTGRVKGLIRARPCIDVISFRETGQRLGRPVVQSIMAGDRHSEQGRSELAYDNYLRALQPDLPPSYQLLVQKRVAEGLRRLGRHEEAAGVEGGGILGASGPPQPTVHAPGSLLGDPLPGTPGAPAAPGATVPPLITTDDLPGQPVGGTSGAVGGGGAAPQLPAPTRAPGRSDLPGTPVERSPVTRDLPGVPAAEARPPITTDLPGVPAGRPEPELPPIIGDEPPPPAVPPAPRVRPVPPQPSPPVAPTQTPSAPAATEEAVPPPAPPRLPPRRHEPRMSGVK